MVLGYMCEQHGFVDECDVAESGQRICRDCGNAVTGVTGHTRSTRRSPPEEESWAKGVIEWEGTEYSQTIARVMAFDLHDAAKKLIKQVDNPQVIKKIRPTERTYRKL